MNVYCYHQIIEGFDALEMLGIWREYWELAGFNPVVLGIADAKKSSYYDSLVQSTSQLPSQNPLGYDQACWVRWAAF